MGSRRSISVSRTVTTMATGDVATDRARWASMPNVGAVAQWASSTTTRTGAAALAVITRSATASNIRQRRLSGSVTGGSGRWLSSVARPGTTTLSSGCRAVAATTSGGVVVAHLVMASTKGWKGAPTSSSQRPHSTSAPSSAHASGQLGHEPRLDRLPPHRLPPRPDHRSVGLSPTLSRAGLRRQTVPRRHRRQRVAAPDASAGSVTGSERVEADDQVQRARAREMWFGGGGRRWPHHVRGRRTRWRGRGRSRRAAGPGTRPPRAMRRAGGHSDATRAPASARPAPGSDAPP